MHCALCSSTAPGVFTWSRPAGKDVRLALIKQHLDQIQLLQEGHACIDKLFE